MELSSPCPPYRGGADLGRRLVEKPHVVTYHAVSCEMTRPAAGRQLASSTPVLPMRSNSLWIETVALGTATACGLALLIATLTAAVVVIVEHPAFGQEAQPSAAPGHTYDGMITCSRCGAKHSANLGKTASDCARICVHGGASFALVDGDRVRALHGDPVLLKRFAGQRAHVVGMLRQGTIEVSSIAPAS